MIKMELPKEDFNLETESDIIESRYLLVHNDDYHTFDYVINALIDICGLDVIQAEQCTLLIHYKGNCDVKKGSFSYLRPMKNALIEKDLKATIE